MAEQSTEKDAPCCPGGWLSGHAYWCASDEAQAARTLGVTRPIPPEESE